MEQLDENKTFKTTRAVPKIIIIIIIKTRRKKKPVGRENVDSV